MTLLSVITPIASDRNDLHNLENWLSKVKSYDIQVILVLDLKEKISNRDTIENLVDKINSNKLILIAGEFGSVGAARNVGLFYAEGEWITFWDSDDLPIIENIFAEISRGPVEPVLIMQYQRVETDSKYIETKMINKENFIKEIFKGAGLWRFIIKSSILKEIRFPPLSMGEDLVFLSQVLTIRDEFRFKVSNLIGYQYFTNNINQMTYKSRSKRPYNAFIAINSYKSQLKDLGTGIQRIWLAIYLRLALSSIKHSKIFYKVKSFIILVNFIIMNLVKLSVIIIKENDIDDIVVV